MYKAETMTLGKTWSDVLPSGGLLDHALVTVTIKNNSAQYSSPQPMILDHITKIEVKTDGKQPCKDYWGQTCLAEYALAMGKVPPSLPDVMSANYQNQVFPILFGRKPFDGDYGLDLSKPSEVRLDISNDFASDDYDGSVMQLDVDLWFLEEPKGSIGQYFQTYEKTANTWTAASQEKTFEVPSEDIVRRMYLGCESARTSSSSAQDNKAWRNLRYLKYTYNSGGIVVRDDDLYRSDQDVLWGYPDKISTEALLEARADLYFDTMLCRPVQVNVCSAYSAAPGSDQALTIDQRVERFLKFRKCTTDGMQARMAASGYGPFDHLCIHEDQPDTPEGYLVANAKKKVEVQVGNSSSGGSSGTIRFALQALKSQPS
jgi:hypothetical protein